MRCLSDNPRSMNRLPDDVLEKIFCYFTYDELYERLSYVCVRWKKIVETMRKNIIFHETDSSEVIKAIYSFPDTFETVSLSNIKGDISFILRNMKKYQKNLKEVMLDKVKIVSSSTKASGRLLRKLFQSYPELEVISLKSVEFDVDFVIPALPQLENLRSLTIGDNPQLRAVDLQSIILNCENLDSVHLYKLYILSDQDMRFMLCNNRIADKLKQLTLDRVYGLNMVSYEYILDCYRLERLSVRVANNLSGETIARIPDYLKELKSLTLEKVCGIYSTDFVHMFDKGMDLIEFHFRDCCSKFDDEALQALVSCLHNTLVSLQLQNCSNLRHIDFVKECKHLRNVNLSGCIGLNYDGLLKCEMHKLQSLKMPDCMDCCHEVKFENVNFI